MINVFLTNQHPDIKNSGRNQPLDNKDKIIRFGIRMNFASS
jgi:hypothetical protein